MYASATENTIEIRDFDGNPVGEITPSVARRLVTALENAIDDAESYEPGWEHYKDQYSENQIKFCQDMESAGWSKYILPTYSGRGMFGDICPGIVTRTGFSEEDYFDEDDVVRATDVNLSRDGMGMETILYCRY